MKVVNTTIEMPGVQPYTPLPRRVGGRLRGSRVSQPAPEMINQAGLKQGDIRQFILTKMLTQPQNDCTKTPGATDNFDVKKSPEIDVPCPPAMSDTDDRPLLTVKKMSETDWPVNINRRGVPVTTPPSVTKRKRTMEEDIFKNCKRKVATRTSDCSPTVCKDERGPSRLERDNKDSPDERLVGKEKHCEVCDMFKCNCPVLKVEEKRKGVPLPLPGNRVNLSIQGEEVKTAPQSLSDWEDDKVPEPGGVSDRGGP